MKLYIIGLIYFLYYSSTFSQTTNIEDFLNQQTAITYESFKFEDSTKNYFKLKIKQPLDHEDYTKGYFYQTAYLHHKGFETPMVISTEGYSLRDHYNTEVSGILNSNQIGVEHRFFGESKPETENFNFLNLKQVTADLHHIHEIFEPIYTLPWVTTGVSKGGSTSLYYNQFYPEDVSACVAYVAPLCFSQEDRRIYRFLHKVGSKSCRNQIEKIQTVLLKERDHIIPKLKKLVVAQGLKFTKINFEKAYELGVLEFSFSFWQSNGDCESLLAVNLDIPSLTKLFIEENSLLYFSDPYVDYFGPHYYQAATEMGYYGYNIKKFKKHLKDLPTNKNPSAILPKSNASRTFDPTITDNLKNWLDNNGNNIIYIYGALDPWTACGVIPSKKVNSKAYILEGKHHMNARIASIDKAQQKEVISLLQKWISE